MYKKSDNQTRKESSEKWKNVQLHLICATVDTGTVNNKGKSYFCISTACRRPSLTAYRKQGERFSNWNC